MRDGHMTNYRLRARYRALYWGVFALERPGCGEEDGVYSAVSRGRGTTHRRDTKIRMPSIFAMFTPRAFLSAINRSTLPTGGAELGSLIENPLRCLPHPTRAATPEPLPHG